MKKTAVVTGASSGMGREFVRQIAGKYPWLEEIYQETLECLKRGYLKEDWLLAPGECRRLAQEAKTIREQEK